MTPTWFNSPARLAQLEAAADRWVGTPWMPNSRSPGPRGGVSCHHLPVEVLRDAGLPIHFETPAGPANWSLHHKDSLMETFLDACGDFADATGEPPLPGDMVGFRIGGCVHHLGVALAGGEFIHAWRNVGTTRALLADPTYAERLARIWRPRP